MHPTIALDAMGGDFAPRTVVAAAAAATLEHSGRVMLVGPQPRLQALLQGYPHDATRLQVVHAPGVLGMQDAPTAVLRLKADCSLRRTIELVAGGEAAAAVSAGHTGGLLVAGKHLLGAVPGVRRPALAVFLPLRRGQVLLLDVGASVNCRPLHLLQFARMGAEYLRCLHQHTAPRIALLANGSESSKGDALVRAAHALLRQRQAGFIGNVEPKDVFRGRAEVVVCDGFVGNLMLKTAEIAGRRVEALIKDQGRSLRGRLGLWLLRPALREIALRANARQVGGALLLGLRGTVVVAHGASTATALSRSIELARRCADQNLPQRLTQSLQLREAGPHSP